MMNDKDLTKFTCNKCRGPELTVIHIWNIQAGKDSESWREWGPLKDNHHWKVKKSAPIDLNLL